MDKKELFGKLFDQKIIAVLAVLINTNKELHLREIAKLANIAPASVSRILYKLNKLKLIDTLKMSTFKAYRFASNEDANFIASLFIEKQNSLDLFVNYVRDNQKIEEIITHGEVKANHANVLIIGNRINAADIDECVTKIKYETDFDISFVCLDRNQYVKMSNMGLYAGKKLTLFSR